MNQNLQDTATNVAKQAEEQRLAEIGKLISHLGYLDTGKRITCTACGNKEVAILQSKEKGMAIAACPCGFSKGWNNRRQDLEHVIKVLS